MKLKGIMAIAACAVILSCKKDDPAPIPEPEAKKRFTLSGIVTSPGGTPLEGILVTFENNVNRYEVTTNASGQYEFEEEEGIGGLDLYYYGKPLRFLDMRLIEVEFGEVDRTLDKMLVPWEIEEIDLLSATFSDNPEKDFSLVHYNFEELKMKPNDFKNLIGSVHLPNYESTFTSAQSEGDQKEITVSFYSMPDDTDYTLENNETITFADVMGWQKILTITTTTTPIGKLEPVKVNLAEAYAEYPDYNHSGTIVMVSDDAKETLDVTSEVDLLEIRLPYGDDYEYQK